MDLIVAPFGLLCGCIGIVIAIGGTVLCIWMLINCLADEPPQQNDKLVWAIVILLTHALGGLIYLFVRRPERIPRYGR
jgi:hypothetical protein